MSNNKIMWSKNRTNTENYNPYDNAYHQEQEENASNYLFDNPRIKVANAFKTWATNLEIKRLSNPNLMKFVELKGRYCRDFGYRYLTEHQRKTVLTKFKKANGFNNTTGFSNLLLRFFLKSKWFDVIKYKRLYLEPWQCATLDDIDFKDRNISSESILDYYQVKQFMYYRKRYIGTEIYQREMKDLIDTINQRITGLRKTLDRNAGIRIYRHFDKYLKFYSIKNPKTNKWEFRVNEPTGLCWIPIITNPDKITPEFMEKLNSEEFIKIIENIEKEKKHHKKNMITARNEYNNLIEVLKKIKIIKKEIKVSNCVSAHN
jgi:hypothetical protein